MGKLLRVLVFIFLALSIGALVLGWMLFEKREVLKGRTQKLEKAFIELSATIEAEDGSLDRRPDYPAKDISPVSSEVLDTPELSTFWDNYSNELELADQPLIQIGREENIQLMSYYKRDPVTQKIEKDALGQKVTEGEGTMQEILQRSIDLATAQNSRLNDTRLALKAARMELVDTITELNQTKNRLRSTLKEVEDLKDEITRLNAEIRTLNAKVEELNEEKRNLEDQIAEQKQQVALLEEKQLEDQAEIERLKKDNDDLRKRLGEFTQGPSGGPEGPVPVVGEPDRILEPGEKGRVIAVNTQWNFAILELTDAFMREILGDDLSGGLPAYELMIKRPGDPEQFVTKVKLMSIKKAEKMAIADILTDWQQVPVEKGDVLFR